MTNSGQYECVTRPTQPQLRFEKQSASPLASWTMHSYDSSARCYNDELQCTAKIAL